jgi:hypothetical protein
MKEARFREEAAPRYGEQGQVEDSRDMLTHRSEYFNDSVLHTVPLSALSTASGRRGVTQLQPVGNLN